MNDFMERLKKIPPWGWAAISVGVLAMSYYMKKAGGGGAAGSATGQTIYSVDPSAATYANDANQNMQSMYTALENEMGNNNTKISNMFDQLNTQIGNKNDSFQSALDALSQQVQDLKYGGAQAPVTAIPSSGAVNPTPAPAASTNQTYYNHGQNPNLGTMTTGTYQDAASAAKVADTLTHTFGPNVRVVGSAGDYRVQADMPTQKGADQLAQWVKDHHLASVAYGQKVG